jgi:hypothetical protein
LLHDVRVFAGDSTGTATEGTKAVPATVLANIRVRSGGQTRSAPLTIRPGTPVPPDQPDVASYTVSPSTFQNGTTATGTVTLTGPAPTGGTRVTFSENVAAIADDQVVPAGQTSITFPVRGDYPLTYPKPISGTLTARTAKPYTLGTPVSTKVTLTPAPDPPPGPFPG